MNRLAALLEATTSIDINSNRCTFSLILLIKVNMIKQVGSMHHRIFHRTSMSMSCSVLTLPSISMVTSNITTLNKHHSTSINNLPVMLHLTRLITFMVSKPLHHHRQLTTVMHAPHNMHNHHKTSTSYRNHKIRSISDHLSRLQPTKQQ